MNSRAISQPITPPKLGDPLASHIGPDSWESAGKAPLLILRLRAGAPMITFTFLLALTALGLVIPGCPVKAARWYDTYTTVVIVELYVYPIEGDLAIEKRFVGMYTLWGSREIKKNFSEVLTSIRLPNSATNGSMLFATRPSRSILKSSTVAVPKGRGIPPLLYKGPNMAHIYRAADTAAAGDLKPFSIHNELNRDNSFVVCPLAF